MGENFAHLCNLRLFEKYIVIATFIARLHNTEAIRVYWNEWSRDCKT